MAEKLKLSEEMGAYRNGHILTAERVMGWAAAAQLLEADLARTKEQRDYNAKVIDQRNAEIGRLQEDLRIAGLERLAALNSKRDSDTAWQKEADNLREYIRENDVAWLSLVDRLKQQLAAAQAVLPQPQSAGGTARGCGGAGLQQHSDRDTMKRALSKALENGSWLSSELLVDAVLMELFPQPGKRLEDMPVPQATRPAAALSFEEVTEPVIEWLNEHYNPHYAIMIENDGATVVSTELHHPTTKFIKD